MTILKTLEAQMSTGIPPTVDQLEEALAVALEERNQFEAILRDVVGEMSKIVVAHWKNDAAGVEALLDAFIAKNVKVIECTNQSGSMH